MDQSITRKGTFLMALALAFSLTGCSSPSTSSSSTESGSASNNSSSMDMKKFPNFVSDYENLKYSFGDKEKTEPYWWGNIMYNETTLMVDDGTSISAKLHYSPKKIISVRNNAWDVEYKEGTDYTIKDNTLVLTEGSSIPHWTEEQLVGVGIPSPYHEVQNNALSDILHDYCVWTGLSIYTESPFFYGNQISVTYAYDVNDIDFDYLPTYQLDKLPNLKAKLEAKSDVKMVTVGDSVSEGCSSSFKFNHEPYMHPWVDLVSDKIAADYGCKVTSVNQSVGGMTSGYTADSDARLKALTDENPDVVFIHYGINDLGAKETPNVYSDNIEKIILNVQSVCPHADVVLVSPFEPNPMIYDTDTLSLYSDKLAKLAKNDSSDTQGVIFIDLFKTAFKFMENKRYADVTANGINHPNDFGHRLYTEAILATLEDPTKK
jgi:lysophospholipase L1-like esterase